MKIKNSPWPSRTRVTALVQSIRFRLAVWFVAILAVVIIAFSGFIYLRQAQNLRLAALSRLDQRTRRMGGLFRDVKPDLFKPDHGMELEMSIDPGSGEAYLQEGDILALISSDGSILQNWGPITLNGIRPAVVNKLRSIARDKAFDRQGSPALTSSTGITMLNVNGLKMRFVLSLTPVYDNNSLRGYYLAGTPVDPGNTLPKLLFSLGLGVLVTLAIAMAGGIWLADRAMRPVKTITQAAQTISETDLSKRLRLKQKDELGLLADTFDEMLDRLQAAFERQRQFTADASHELRTPLTIIDIESQHALAASRTPHEYEQVIRVIHSENQFMARLVNNLLTLARMDGGQVNLHKQILDLSDIAVEVVERLAPLANQRQVRLSAGELPEVLIDGDRQYLAQMLSNLVENAIKYSAGADQRVVVETGIRLTANGLRGWARVSDNGPGIAPEHLSHLFDRFYRVDQARSRLDSADQPVQDGSSADPAVATSGAGLGLSIVQWICKAHGGEVHVQSEPGQGSSFEVELPIISYQPGSNPSQS